jgi:beta-lactamase superfamily II metal-dependent hydrolase
LIDASDHSATVLAQLRRFHVDTLAAVILSHPHSDHYGGLPGVIAAVPVQRFISGGTPRSAHSYVALLHTIAARHIPVVIADTGVRRITLVTGNDTVAFDVLAPPAACRALPSAAEGDAVNNCSLAVRLNRGAFSMLLPGDAETPELGWWMLHYHSLLVADVLKAGHHGSSNATSPEVLDAVRPRAVLISANGRQHPFAQVLTLLAARGIPTYCTADDGTITVRVPRNGPWTITGERARKCHPRTEFGRSPR